MQDTDKHTDDRKNEYIDALNDVKKTLVQRRRDLSIEPTPDGIKRIIKTQKEIDVINRAIEDEVRMLNDNSSFGWDAVQ